MARKKIQPKCVGIHFTKDENLHEQTLKTKQLQIRIDEKLKAELDKLPNMSEFVRKAIIEKLEKVKQCK